MKKQKLKLLDLGNMKKLFFNYSISIYLSGHMCSIFFTKE